MGPLCPLDGPPLAQTEFWPFHLYRRKMRGNTCVLPLIHTGSRASETVWLFTVCEVFLYIHFNDKYHVILVYKYHVILVYKHHVILVYKHHVMLVYKYHHITKQLALYWRCWPWRDASSEEQAELAEQHWRIEDKWPHRGDIMFGYISIFPLSHHFIVQSYAEKYHEFVVCCRLYCYKGAAWVTMPTATNT